MSICFCFSTFLISLEGENHSLCLIGSKISAIGQITKVVYDKDFHELDNICLCHRIMMMLKA